MDKFFVYIIHSSKLDSYYIGTTDDVAKRVNEHNEGFYKGAYTSKGIPCILLFEFECKSSELAYKLESFIKRMKSRKFIERVIENPEILEEIQSKL